MRLLTSDTAEYLLDTAHSIFLTNLTVKSFGVILFTIITFLFDAGKQQALVALLILMIFDFLFGVTAAAVNKKPITSGKTRRSALKVAIYYLLISAGFLAEKSVPFLPIDETILAFLMLTELISIIENSGKIGFAVPKKLLEQLTKFRDSQ